MTGPSRAIPSRSTNIVNHMNSLNPSSLLTSASKPLYLSMSLRSRCSMWLHAVRIPDAVKCGKRVGHRLCAHDAIEFTYHLGQLIHKGR